MQQEKLDSPCCRVKTCPADKSPQSAFGYCPIHNRIATDPDMFQKALSGKINSTMKVFAEDIERGIYPKRNW